jgi:hypothetical protein
MYPSSLFDGPSEMRVRVTDYRHPLVKVEYPTGAVQIINTSSPAFVSATLRVVS